MSFKFEIGQAVLVPESMQTMLLICRVKSRTEHVDHNSYNLSVKYVVSLNRMTIRSQDTFRPGIKECSLSSSAMLSEAMGRLEASQDRVDDALDDMAGAVLHHMAKEDVDE